MNYKRKKSHRSPRCTMCTQDSWKGNAKDRFDAQTRRRKMHANEAIGEAISYEYDEEEYL